MRIRTAKTLARRIDLQYFKHPHGLRRWRYALSAALPVIALLWIGGYAAAGSRKPYSAGPLSGAHAFAEARCEVCHARSGRAVGFRAHVSDRACLTCHDAPAHAANQTTPPACAACHQEHGGRVRLARTDEGFCAACHAELETTNHKANIVSNVGRFPSGHPEFAVLRNHVSDPGTIKFNHAVHMKKEGVRGRSGVEQLACTQCHKPEIARSRGKRPIRTGLMTPVTYADACARCHPLYFDERIDAVAPHEEQRKVRAFVTYALTNYIELHRDEMDKPDRAVSRVPLNFPRPPEPPARTPEEWVARRLTADERLLWSKTCAECHQIDRNAFVSWGPGVKPYPLYAASNITRRWMPRAAFDHTPHQMLQCAGCHPAETSRDTSDVLMPGTAACATCHAPSKGASSGCFECHAYHDWSHARPVEPAFKLTDFR